MLRRLSADDPRFKTATFTGGLNLVVSETTPTSAGTDSRNSAGKSSMIELIHFLLGATADKRSLFCRRELRSITFELELDWPQTGDLRVSRSGGRPSVVNLRPDVRAAGSAAETIFELAGTVESGLEQWNRLIERDLFGVRESTPDISGRTLLSFLIRRVSSHGFNEPTRTFSRQAEAVATTNLAYLLGLDWQLAARYRQIAARQATRNQLRKAVNDPVWGRIVGSTAELRGQITLAEAQVRRLREQIAAFQVVPEYERVKERADGIARRISQLAQQDVIDQANLHELREAVAEASDVEVDYLEPVYQELGVVLGEQVRRRFEDVRTFHSSVVRNRRQFLESEMSETTRRIEARRLERSTLGDDQARLLSILHEGGALEALTSLQQALAREQASLEALRHRFEAAQTLESSARQITAERLELQQALMTDLNERVEQTDEAVLLFSRYAQELYGTGREAYLAIDAGPHSLTVRPHIHSDDSRGIGNMVIFCFDLAIAVVAHRHGRGPDFLVHDSHLFDGVDERQLAAALQLAAEVSRYEGMQYIATLNGDILEQARNRGFDPSPYVREPHLTDGLDDGGLFGFRF
ncbi:MULTISPECIES: ABC-three component system protein [unclassified Streptomyces]|uniref:ABC-three component system protein n=1 Tax=unclassified Streptomyces TaxID=2593676 RepID=UPI000CD546B5|nr:MULTISPECIES: ABC-three component system protein [unclassified Streptomyces]